MNTRAAVFLTALCAAALTAPQISATTQVIQPQAGGQPVAQPRPGTGAVMGQVVDARGVGVPGAIVRIQGGYQPIALTTTNREIPGGPRQTITNRTGYFAFFELTPGTYAFDANKPGFIAGAYGRMRPGGQAQSITLKDGEHHTSIRIAMWDLASVSGTIRDETGEPVVGVQVRALRRAFINGRFQWTTAPAVVSNDRGEYRIDSLTPGQYVVVVAATQTSLPLSEIDPRASSNPEVQIQLFRAGLSGAPGSNSGREVAGWSWNSGGRTAMTVPNPSDDGRLSVYPTTFYPSARSSREAEMVALEPGQERSAVDFQMRLVPATTVAGVVTSAEGPTAGLVVRLVPDYAEDLSGDLRGLETAATVCDSQGRFLFVGVPVGQYFVQAEALPAPAAAPNAPTAQSRRGWLNERLVVGEGGIADAAFPLRPAVRITGRLAFEGTKPPPPPELIQRLVVSIETIDFAVNRIEAPYQANFDRNGNFVLPSVPPGRYVLTFRAAITDRQAMPDWETKGVTHQGRDVSDRVMTITDDVSDVLVTLTNNNTSLAGSVRDGSGKVDPTAAVLLFTAERDLWGVRMVRRIRALRASETGEYSVRGVPPGDYFLIAIPDVDLGDYPDPRMLEALSKSAMRIVMAPAEQKKQDLILRAVK